MATVDEAVMTRAGAQCKLMGFESDVAGSYMSTIWAFEGWDIDSALNALENVKQLLEGRRLVAAKL